MGLGSQKIDFFITFFNSITIEKVNAKVLNPLDEKWKNDVRSTFCNENVFQNFVLVFLEILFLFRFAVIAKNGGSDRFENFFVFYSIVINNPWEKNYLYLDIYFLIRLWK